MSYVLGVLQYQVFAIKRNACGILVMYLLTFAGDARILLAQQANQPSQRTGRSYDTGNPSRKPPPPVAQSPSQMTFTDITARTGVTFRHSASPTSRKYLLETMGGGVALFDYDNDGRLDLFFTNGAALNDPMTAGTMPVKNHQRYWNRLYHQKPDGTFEDVTEGAGFQGSGYCFGVAAGDFDNDGFVDLYVTAYGGNTLYRNRGDGTFADVTEKAGVRASGWSTSAGWIDYDRDGLLDLLVLRYLDWDFERGDLFCGQPAIRAFCHPDNFKPATDILFHQKPDGSFEDVSAKTKIASAPGKGLGVAFADFDSDGYSDIFVANDSVRQTLFHNKSDGTFEDVALISGAGYDESGKTFAGMGIDAADYDNDGLPDIVSTALSNETYPLFHNNGDLSFTYVTQPAGLGQITLLYSGWGTRFADFDNDGLRDIFVAQGHVLDTIEKTTSYLKYKQPPLLMRNTGKGFVNVSASAGAPMSVPLAARGAAFGDIDNDGDTDVVIAQLDGPPVVLRNNGSKNHWLGLTLIGTKSNRQAFGARIVVTDSTGRKQTFDVSNAGSYLSSSDPRILVGLGTATKIEKLEVGWPSGGKEDVKVTNVDRYLKITEGKGAQ